MQERTLQKLALFGTLASIFDLTHAVMDQWGQAGWAAVNKGLHGTHRVTADGSRCPTQTSPQTATSVGRRATTHHVACYTLGQVVATMAVTRALGLRIPRTALLAGTALNASTHWIIDRREPLFWAARKTGHGQYVDSCGVVRTPGGEPELTGPGTAAMELDQSAHRFIGMLGAVIMTVFAFRGRHGV
jgi:hypothetical protein